MIKSVERKMYDVGVAQTKAYNRLGPSELLHRGESMRGFPFQLYVNECTTIYFVNCTLVRMDACTDARAWSSTSVHNNSMYNGGPQPLCKKRGAISHVSLQYSEVEKDTYI